MDGPLWKNDPNGITLLELLGNIKDYSIFNNHLQYLGNSGSNTTIENLADWLINRSRFVGATKAISELDFYMTSKEVEVDYIEPILETISERDFEFVNGVKFLSASNLRNKLFANYIVAGWESSLIPMPRVIRCLSCSYMQTVQHTSNLEYVAFPIQELPFEKTEDVRLCLSLARSVEYGIFHIGSTSVAPDEFPFIHYISGWNVVPFKRQNIQPHILEIEFKIANDILNKFSKINPDFKEKLKIPLRKLNNYGSSESLVDKAIDLRICLESIFLTDGNTEQLRYRLSLRAALYLGSSLEERKELFKLAKDVYDITSSAVHNGKFSKKDKTELLDNGAMLAKKALIKLIENGEINWEDLELKN